MPPTSAWPELDYAAWLPTLDTLHMWTQIVGKTRLALTPMQNHWWNVPLYVSVCGLTTSPMPLPGGQKLEVEFDFVAHVLHLRLSTRAALSLPLRAQSVAAFFAEYTAALHSLGLQVPIWPVPVELAKPIPFREDHIHNAYDPAAIERFHQVLLSTDTVLKRFATGFFGKISPVHFFWGSFDLCVTRFNGLRTPGPPNPDRVQQESYSHQVISAGFWPGNGGFGSPAFYCYAVPVPPSLSAQPIAPGAFNPQLGEFILPYDEVRQAADPAAHLLAFLESTYTAAADAAQWDRASLDRAVQTAPVAQS